MCQYDHLASVSCLFGVIVKVIAVDYLVDVWRRSLVSDEGFDNNIQVRPN